jgi:hypothetical protein
VAEDLDREAGGLGIVAEARGLVDHDGQVAAELGLDDAAVADKEGQVPGADADDTARRFRSDADDVRHVLAP